MNAALRDATVGDIEWRLGGANVAYEDAIAVMEKRADEIRRGEAPEMIWLLQHPPLYTAGTSAGDDELLDPGRFPVYRTGRGGRYTYHGPGQRVAYVMLDLQKRGADVRRYVRDLEAWLICTLARFGVTGERRADRIGIWVMSAGEDAKIAAIGVRIRRWVTFHGVALNVDPKLAHFDGIVPCGIEGYGVTSLAALGVAASMEEVDQALKECFAEIFGG